MPDEAKVGGWVDDALVSIDKFLGAGGDFKESKSAAKIYGAIATMKDRPAGAKCQSASEAEAIKQALEHIKVKTAQVLAQALQA